jgi:carbon-monoxide dehydrogenase catalytic subunit
MITKARTDTVEPLFERANDMPACLVGVQSACGKHFSMGPYRLNGNNPYDGVGGCGATIDTIMAGNLGMMASAQVAAHTNQGMAILEFLKVPCGYGYRF